MLFLLHMFYYNWFISDLFFEITCNTIPQVNTNNNITIGKDTPVLGFSGTLLIVPLVEIDIISLYTLFLISFYIFIHFHYK